MRRLWRIFLNALTVLSLLFSLASAVLWVRSYFRFDNFGWLEHARHDARSRWLNVRSAEGGVILAAGSYLPGMVHPNRPQGWFWTSDHPRPGMYSEYWLRYAVGWTVNRWGFGRHFSQSFLGQFAAIVVPAWLPMVLFAAFPLARGALFIRRRRRVREGHCRKCGYDLRATPDRCPECGTASARPPAPAARPGGPPSPS